MSAYSITIATPVYNREDCIGRCIESVMAQTMQPFEFMIVDDGSSDRTVEIIRRYQQQYPLINFFPVSPNKGENYARNRCLEHSKGDFIFWLDSDDWLVPDTIAKMHTAIEKHPGYLHYMLVPSDRQEEFAASEIFSQSVHETTYADWLTGRVKGDFSHVMHRSVFEGCPFFEDIRSFAGINFIRIHRKSGKQLFVNQLATIRERGREDALTRTGFLDNKRSITEQYVNINYMFKYFEGDMERLDIKLLERKLKKNILLGVAIDEIEKNKELLTKLTNIKVSTFPYAMLNRKLFSGGMYSLLVCFSRMKRLIKPGEFS